MNKEIDKIKRQDEEIKRRFEEDRLKREVEKAEKEKTTKKKMKIKKIYNFNKFYPVIIFNLLLVFTNKIFTSNIFLYLFST